jgi:hypothetical protein
MAWRDGLAEEEEEDCTPWPMLISSDKPFFITVASANAVDTTCGRKRYVATIKLAW